MKEKLLQFSALIALTAVLLLGAGGYGIAAAADTEQNADRVKTAQAEKQEKKEEKTEAKTEAKETAKKSEKQDDKKAEEKKSGDGKKETEKKETKAAPAEEKQAAKETGSVNTAAPEAENSNVENTAAVAQTPAPAPAPEAVPEPAPAPEQASEPEPPAHVHSYNPVYGEKYVVDQPAWTEPVSEPVYEMVEIAICNGCGADITGNAWGHIDAQLDAGVYSCGGYHSEWVPQQTGTNTYTIDHPEQGHMEPVVTCYQCSCGAVQ